VAFVLCFSWWLPSSSMIVLAISANLQYTNAGPWDLEVCVSYYRECDMWLWPCEPCSICPAYNAHCKRLYFYSGIMCKEFTFGFHLGSIH
jgi:hypothetical protein